MTNTKSSSKKVSSKIGVVDSFKLAFRKKNRTAFLLGSILGGVVPCAAYEVAHFEVKDNPYMWVIVVACLVYSAKSVFEWANVAFRNCVKAAGFCVILEGVLTFSHCTILAYVVLAILVSINAICAGTGLVLDQKNK